MGDERITRQCRRCGGWPRHASCTCPEGPLFDPPAPQRPEPEQEAEFTIEPMQPDGSGVSRGTYGELPPLDFEEAQEQPTPPEATASDEGRFDALRHAWQVRGSLLNMEMIELLEITDRGFARLRQLRADGELYRRMLDQSNATLDAEGRRVGIEMGCDTAHWMAEEILGLRAHGERLRASNHRLAGVLLGEVQRAREEAAREQRERDATLCHVGAEECTRTAATMFAEGRREASRAFRNKADALRDMAERIRSQPPGAAQPQEGV